jgi:hypothetical protein
MKSNLLRSFLCCSTAVVGAFLAPALISTPVHAGPVLAPVGPTPPGVYDKVTVGYLQVFSRTEQTQWGEGSYYNVHSAYWIYDSAGKRIRTVENHSSSIDESPEKVELAPGTYTVKAWSDNDGLVAVPVVVKLARTTNVHLEEGSQKQAISSDRAVTTPSGQIVGWKA